MHCYRLNDVLPEQIEADPELQHNPAACSIARIMSDGRERTRGEILERFWQRETSCYEFGLRAIDRMVKLHFLDVRIGDVADDPDRQIQCEFCHGVDMSTAKSFSVEMGSPGDLMQLAARNDWEFSTTMISLSPMIFMLRIGTGFSRPIWIDPSGNMRWLKRVNEIPSDPSDPSTQSTPAEEPDPVQPLALAAAG